MVDIDVVRSDGESAYAPAMNKTPFRHTITMMCSQKHLIMAKNLKLMIKRYEKNGEDTSSMQALVRGHTFLAYNIMVDGTDHDDGKKEEDFLQ